MGLCGHILAWMYAGSGCVEQGVLAPNSANEIEPLITVHNIGTVKARLDDTVNIYCQVPQAKIIGAFEITKTIFVPQSDHDGLGIALYPAYGGISGSVPAKKELTIHNLRFEYAGRPQGDRHLGAHLPDQRRANSYRIQPGFGENARQRSYWRYDAFQRNIQP